MKHIFTLLFAALAFVACTQNDVEELSANRADVPEILTIGFEGDDTRIQLEAGKTVWTSGDLVSVFYKSDANQQWEYRGETGARVADLHCVDEGVESSKMNYVVVAFPYNPDYIISTASGNIETTLPAVQHYAEESYGVGENLMVSRSEFTQFSLKSVCGWLKIQLTGNGERVQSITLRGNNEEQLAGLIYVDTATAESTLASEMGSADDNNAGGNLVFDDTIVTELTLDCGEGVVLGAEATSFYFALPPQTFEGGFTVDVECEDYEPMVISTENRITIQRNTIQPMATIELDADAINDTIYYTATVKINKNWNFNTFGANILSHEWNSETGEGVITFDADVTTIGYEAFYRCTSLTSITIPDSVTTIGGSAFYHCDSLTSVTIGDSVTTIGNYAFLYCGTLTSVTIPDSVTTTGYEAFYGCTSLTEFNGKFASEDGRCLIVDGTLNSFAPAGLTSYTIPDSVTTIGSGAFGDCKSLTSITIPDSVTTIGAEAFYSCLGLTSITIPDSVTTIGNNAFYGCKSLTSVTIPDSVTTIEYDAFAHCYGLTSITIPDSVTTIEADAFLYCISLTSISIPDSVTTIEDEAFYNCKSLASVYCEATTPPSLDGSYVFDYNASGRTIYVPAASVEAYKTAEYWSKYADYIIGYDFENGVVIEPNKMILYTATAKVEANSNYPWSFNTFGANILSHDFNEESGEGVITFNADVTTIGNYAFYSCNSLTSVTIPDSVATIGYEAFNDCDSLTSVTIGDSVTTIGERAFYSCDILTSITIPDSVTTIGEWAFAYCTSLTSVTIPDSVTAIGNFAFCSCDSLTEFNGKFASEDGRCLIVDGTLNSFAPAGLTSYTIPDSVTTIGNYAFTSCDSLTSVTIPDSVTTIGNGAFWGCGSLTSITIPDSVTTIGDYAFSSCDSLTSVTIGDSVTTIGYAAFTSCDSLTSVTIPDSVTTIGNEAFWGCGSLTSVYCEATTPPSLGGSNVFDYNASGRTIYVPAASVEAYKSAAGWSEYADYIIGYDFEKGEVVESETPTSTKPSNDEIWYTTSYNTNPYNSYREPFDVEIISNTYDSENERWVIKLAGEVTKINDSAFEAQGQFMTSITIPESVTEIGNFAFNNCFELKAIDIPKNVTSIGNWAFHYCTSFTSVTIPNSVETIGDYAFAYCEKLAEFKGKFAADNGRCLIVNGDLNAYAIGCNTTQYTIPDGVVSLGERSFAGAIKLTEVVIPSSVNEVCSQAFQDCSSLASLYCESQLPPTFSRDVLYGVASNLRIYVPATSVEVYKAAAGWSVYADAIVGYDFENGVVVE